MQAGFTVVEPVFVPDCVVTELIRVEHIGGGMFRFTFATPTETENVLEVKARLVLSAGSALRGSLWSLREIGARCCGCFLGSGQRLH